jgi:hypothetical protein
VEKLTGELHSKSRPLGGSAVYRLFVDEVGHHSLETANDPSERYLCLVGVIMDLDYADTTFSDSLDALKVEVFGTRDVVLHRRELIDKAPAPFDRLKDQNVEKRFNELLIEWIKGSKYTVITVLIDKKLHSEQYVKWHFQPYHYCLTALVERYVRWLEEENATGDVMAEAREKKQNIKLENSFKHIFRNGTGFPDSPKRFVPAELMQKHLTSGELKTKTKKANVPGLQLVDIIANPARRHLLCNLQRVPMRSAFSLTIVRILIAMKYRRCRWGKRQIWGYGVKILP